MFSDAMGADGRYEGTYPGMMDHSTTVIARALAARMVLRRVLMTVAFDPGYARVSGIRPDWSGAALVLAVELLGIRVLGALLVVHC